MSWEIKGQVDSEADVDALVASPSETPSDAEQGQVEAVAVAVKGLVGAGVVRPGPLTVRAGGHANADGGWVEGQVCEMVTLTVEYVRPPAEPESTETVVKPTWGDAKTNTPEQVAAAEARAAGLPYKPEDASAAPAASPTPEAPGVPNVPAAATGAPPNDAAE